MYHGKNMNGKSKIKMIATKYLLVLMLSHQLTSFRAKRAFPSLRAKRSNLTGKRLFKCLLPY